MQGFLLYFFFHGVLCFITKEEHHVLHQESLRSGPAEQDEEETMIALLTAKDTSATAKADCTEENMNGGWRCGKNKPIFDRDECSSLSQGDNDCKKSKCCKKCRKTTMDNGPSCPDLEPIFVCSPTTKQIKCTQANCCMANSTTTTSTTGSEVGTTTATTTQIPADSTTTTTTTGSEVGTTTATTTQIPGLNNVTLAIVKDILHLALKWGGVNYTESVIEEFRDRFNTTSHQSTEEEEGADK